MSPVRRSPGGAGPGRRVVVTGLGAIGGWGIGVDALWDALVAGPNGPPPDWLGDAVRSGAFDPTRWMPRAEARRTAPYVHAAVAAGAMALDRALGVGGSALGDQVDPARIGVFVGHTHGPSDRIEAEDERRRRDGAGAVAPFLTVLSVESAPAAALAARLGAKGPVRMSGGACASGAFAVGDGLAAIRHGRCDAVLVGGTAGPLAEVLAAAYRNIRVISPSGVVRPFDVRRDGFVYRPAASVLVLEALDVALARGAELIAEVLGFADTNDGGDPVHPSGDGARAAVELALADAGVGAGEVRFVNAHGSATTANDQLEAGLVASLFPHRPAVTSAKGVTGHSLGGAGALEVLATCLSIERGVLPPAVVEHRPDPAIETTGVDIVVGVARPWTPGVSLSLSYGLGGQNGAVVLGPPTPGG